MSRRRIFPGSLPLLAAALALAFVPSTAGASPNQFSILQDDAVLLSLTERDPDLAMAEAKGLGVDVVRTFVTWNAVVPRPQSREMPERFDAADPNSKGYDWRYYDAFVDRARRHGLKVFLTLAPPIPYWASEEPERCPHFVGGYRNLGTNCHWKPQPRLFGQFASAVVQRYGSQSTGPYGGQVEFYSMYNEPNLEHYLYPQARTSGAASIDVAAARYRRLWYEGWKAVAQFDAPLRGKVLFGETSAISSPIDTLYAALCLDQDGRPFRGRLRALQGCNRPRKLPIGGFAVHPYNADASGTVFTRPHSDDSLPMAALHRLHRVGDRAARYGRIPRSGRGIYLTEFGFQTNPPDKERGLTPARQAAAVNEAERLFYADRRVKSFAQFELFDVPEPRGKVDVYNTGLHFEDGELKPSWRAFRMPLVVTRLSAGSVEVWGQVRHAVDRTKVAIAVSRGRGGFAPVRRPLTNASGYFRVRVRTRNAAKLRYQLRWRSPEGELNASRVATAGKRIRYAR